jgi:RNA polymerase sigma-70 factor, ECF subfamily
MPPSPTWYRGHADIATFLAERVFTTPWQFSQLRVSGQPAMVGYRCDPESGRYELHALNVFTLEGERIAAITAFLDPGVLARLGLSRELPPPDR